ncbi:hypothetical protein L1D44_21595 [Shewanella sp. Isolate13]|uniref:hypothetical protein n=1 Tax=Shewanella sp. Isolate13 TaxID=2908531 RepID=UPI001EFC3E7D|nr:hypothetical protein [Shewanella sp. Isolate13]MCG9732373.1 hypothetical protein [Shewanella sp. Isolate13]
MNKMTKVIIPIMLLSLMSACSQQVQEKELSEHFMDNQSKFERLSNLSCTLLNNDFKAMQYAVGDYDNRESKAKTNEQIKDYKFKWANLNKYGAQFENNLKEIDKLLVDLDVDEILIRELSGECRLYIDVWSIWMTGEGQEMGYLFNPETIYEYDPEIHSKSNRDLKTQIDFTLPLSSGWYVGYSNTP